MGRQPLAASIRFGEPSVAVLDHDHGGIDQHPDRERKPPEGHDVARDVQEVHRDERGDDRDRDGENRDQRRAEMPQEQYDHEAHHQRLFDEIALEGVDRSLDET